MSETDQTTDTTIASGSEVVEDAAAQNTQEPGGGVSVEDGAATIDESRAWINDLPDELKTNGSKTFHKFTKGDDTSMVSVPESLLNSHLSLEKMLTDQRKVPDTPEEKTAFYEEMGWKSDFEEYAGGIKRAKMPDGVEYDQSEHDYLIQLAHESHLPLDVVQERYDAIVEQRIKDIQTHKETRAAYMNKVEGDFKAQYGGDLEVMKTRAKTAIQQYDSPEFIDILDNVEHDGVKLGDHPAMFDFFAKLGKEKLGLGRERGDEQSDQSSIQEQIDELEKTGSPYWDKGHPQHNSYVLKMQELNKRLTGEI